MSIALRAARRLAQQHHVRHTPLRAAWLSTSAADAELLSSERESMEYDVCVVGAGPAGLATAIRLAQLNAEHETELSICVLEKGAEVGAHVLSGNVFEPRALDELLPGWRELDAPIEVEAKADSFHFLTEGSAIPLPTPPELHNDGNYIISLAELCAWLAEQAEELGVEVYPGFAASELLYADDGSVRGVATSDMGVGKDGKPRDGLFTRGMEMRARQLVLAEGARGSCSIEAIDKFGLREEGGEEGDGADEQSYGLGLKEVWEIDPEKHSEGSIMHTLGWPLDTKTYGGSFLYHWRENQVLLGFVVGLDYPNPYVSPYQEFQRWKTHPKIAALLEGGACVSYGARVINEGGIQAVPKLSFPGGVLVGCSAGFVNVAKIKGSHTALKTGMLAADEIYGALAGTEEDDEATQGLNLESYDAAVRGSWVWEELHGVRNIHPSFKNGLYAGMTYSALDSYLLKGRGKTLHGHPAGHTDADATDEASQHTTIEYPQPDGKLTFSILDNLARTGVDHEGDQPAHLLIKPELEHLPGGESMTTYAAPESRFCPAKVYEYAENADSGKQELIINAQNCIHCKCCSIKTPGQYINWTTPEGGGGPNYSIM